MKVYRDVIENGEVVSKEIFDIIECTYSGKFMGERSITANIEWASPIDFKIGDYIDIQMIDIYRGADKSGRGLITERFYLYTLPTIKKTARKGTHGKGFEHTITFYPAQYELACVQMRDMGGSVNANNVIFTGFDNVTFYGGAAELMFRIMNVLAEVYKDSNGNPLWDCVIHQSVNEIENPALERFAFTFSGNTVMDALLKLSDKEGINTTFFINNRTIYVGFNRAYFCRVTDQGFIDSNPNTQMFSFKYGKTSHESIALPHGGLYEITKSIGNEMPITKLYVYGGSRNLNRYYCSDRIASGRYVNRLMLPSFSNDGKTDYILSDEVNTHGIKEGTKHLEDIYPSLRYVTYGDIRQIKYCIKVKSSGLLGDNLENSAYPVARVQCYRVIESDTIGVNTLVEAAPPDDLAIFVHALGKTIKVVLYGGVTNEDAIAKQREHDNGIVPTYTKDGDDYIPGSCFLVHNRIFDGSDVVYENSERASWFDNVADEQVASKYNEKQKNEIELNQINYTDTFWLTDLYVFTSPHQTYFNRVGYSAWAYPKLNSNYTSDAGHTAHNTVNVNEIVLVEPVVIEDTSANIIGVDDDRNQQTFDLYLRDIGFKIDEQNDFGEYVFVVADTLKVSILDGNLTGQEFEVSKNKCICAFNEDGTLNDKFFEDNGYSGRSIPEQAFDNGAIWRLTCKRTNLEEPDYANLNIALPNTLINANAGDHIVLLDIYMPDIYIQAAENRLLREGRKCLRSLDKGKTSYAVNFDKVRMQQIPNYALQMREGLNIRMEDDDLNICTVNRQTILFDGILVTNTSMYETTYDSKPTVDYYYTIENRDFFYINDNLLNYYNGLLVDSPGTLYFKIENNASFGGNFNWKGILYGTLTDEDADSGNEVFAKDGKMKIRLLSRKLTPNGTMYELTDQYITVSVTNLRKSSNPNEFIADFTFSPLSSAIAEIYNEDGQNIIFGVIEYDMRIEHSFDSTEYTPNTHIVPWGSLVYAPSKTLIEFTAGKHYEIVMEASNTELLKTSQDGRPKFVLMNGLSGDSLMFEPITVVMLEDMSNGYVRYTFMFDLNSSFNDSVDYYPALVYVSDNRTESVSTKLISVIESDLDGNKDLNYADFTIQEITIKITDSSNRTFAQPIKEISATFSEQHNASAWVELMNQVEQNTQEGESNHKLIETFANSARKNYQSLLNLRDYLFDPDGNIAQTFLQIMMLQVGADSMNYELDKTRTAFNSKGEVVLTNCLFGKGSDDKYHFKVDVENKLFHFVYSSNGGDWDVKSSQDFVLDAVDENGKPLPYFVCIKCKRLTSEAEWVCDTIQHKVNEDDEYWYFNWCIIVPDSVGYYTLTETRGNAYMYGDNLVCGKISDLAKRCYFDLTKGEFALGMNDDGTAALSYIDGVLTVGGIPDADKINELIEALNKSNNQVIGGENFVTFDNGDYTLELEECDSTMYENNIVLTSYTYSEYGTISYDLLPAGDYVFSAKKLYCIAFDPKRGDMPSGTVKLFLVAQSQDNTYRDSILLDQGNVYNIKITTTSPCYFSLLVQITGMEVGCSINGSFLGMILQSGTKSTSYTNYVKHLSNAFQQSTDITGGVVATSLINLRGETGEISAGMSGLQDNNNNSYGVSMWAGGTYLDALSQASAYATGILSGLEKVLPILLTKSGIGSKIGCLEIVSTNQAAIYSRDRKSRILLSAIDESGILSIKMQELVNNKHLDKVVIANESIFNNVETATYKGVMPAIGGVVSEIGEAMPQIIETNESIVLNGDGWKSNIDNNDIVYLFMRIKTDSQVKKLKFGDDSKLMFVKMGNTVNTIAEVSLKDVYATYVDKNWSVKFEIKLSSLGLNTKELTQGQYKIRLYADTYVRTSSFGNTVIEHYYNERFVNGKIYFALSQDIYFTRTQATTGSIIKMGNNGIIVSSSSSSNFIVRSDDTSKMNVVINGLPNSSDDVETGGLYRNGNTLMIK